MKQVCHCPCKPGGIGFSVWTNHGYFYPEGPRGVETEYDIVKLL